RDWKVAADRVELSYVRDPNLDTPLTRNAVPVLRNLHEHLGGQPISVILTDAAGVVLSRMTADRDLERRLDSVQLAPGFSYAEERVGTNGIGTALEGGQPAHVFGHEHYAEDLEIFGCAGVPINDPLTGKLLGVVDLTCWRKDADALLVALAKTTADQITSALLTDSTARESRLLHEYLRACRHTSGIAHVKLIEHAAARHIADAGPRKPMFLPGLVGSAPLWLRGCSQVEAVYHSGEWLALEGEPGVGKLAVLRAVQQRHDPAGRLSM